MPQNEDWFGSHHITSAEEWNASVSKGTPVRYFPVLGDLAHLQTRTVSEAWEGPQPPDLRFVEAWRQPEVFVKVEGRVGGVSIRHLVIAGKDVGEEHLSDELQHDFPDGVYGAPCRRCGASQKTSTSKCIDWSDLGGDEARAVLHWASLAFAHGLAGLAAQRDEAKHAGYLEALRWAGLLEEVLAEPHKACERSWCESARRALARRVRCAVESDVLLREYAAGRRDFRGADLREANLRWADLRKAYLGAADLRGADLSKANFGGANFGGGVRLHYSGVWVSPWPRVQAGEATTFQCRRSFRRPGRPVSKLGATPPSPRDGFYGDATLPTQPAASIEMRKPWAR